MNPQDLQNLCDQYKAMVDAGSITKEEYLQLLTGINIMAEIMIESETKDLDRRAKDLVIKGLKGETV